MDCIPPWLSSKVQCGRNITTYNYSKKDIEHRIRDKFINLKFWHELTKAELDCKNPCKKMTNLISLRADYTDIGTTALHFRFKKNVKVEKKIVSYTGFNFIIDVGSSLGLWLGLSALGITDLAIEAFILFNKWLTVK